jgi:tetratricopeptide (TPR) repeat protein/predicted transcriptional regulator
VVTPNTSTPAAELLATIIHRRAFLNYLLAEESPTPKQTVINEMEFSQPTVDSALNALGDWDLIERDETGISPTLLAALSWKTYCGFDQQIATIGSPDSEDNTLPLWQTTDERQTVMEVVANRLNILERVEMPREKQDLVHELDDSRSTVDRAIRKLDRIGIVDRTAAGYTTTPEGQQVIDQYSATITTLTDILAVHDILADLPHGYPIQPALLADATIERPDDAMPYHLSEGVRERIAAAEHVRLYLPVFTTPQLLDCCHHQVVQEELTLNLLTTPSLFETLTAEFPGPLAAMAAAEKGGHCTAAVADSSTDTRLPFGLVLAKSGGSTTISVIAYGDQHTVQAIIHNETSAAVEWAENCYADASDDARKRTATLRELAPAQQARAPILSPGSPSERVEREAEGFVQLTPEYFAQHAPAPPLTGWRAGFDLVDVHAGYALDREIERDGTRQNLTEELVDRLHEATNQAVLGPPGSGKSTVCKAVACRWYAQGLGPVFYRESGTGVTFDSPAVLREQLQTAATTGHVLVVIEDAVRTEANVMFRVMQAFRGNASVTFLLDAREGEWTDPEMMPPDARRDAYREDVIETVFVPSLDDTEAERFVRQFAQTTDQKCDHRTAHQLRKHESTGEEEQLQDSVQSSGDAPGELLLFLHRLVLTSDPLASYTTATPTTLIEDVKRTYNTLEDTGSLALDVGVLVNMLNAAGIGVSAGLVCSLVATEDDLGISAVREALSTLEGRLIFDRETSTSAASSPYRTIHGAWSAQFLDHLLDTETEHAAHQRVGRCLTALLSLADDENLRDQIRSGIPAAGSLLEQIETSPGEWADAIIEQLFNLGLSRPGLAPLFGTTGDTAIDLPDACSQAVTIKCTRWRALMYRDMAALERATHEYEALDTLADEVVTTDPDWAATLRGRRCKGLGFVAWRRGKYDNAEAYYTSAINHFQKADNSRQIVGTQMNLGGVAQTRGDLETAETYYRQSLETPSDVRDTQVEADTLSNLATIGAMTSDLSMAIDQSQECLERYRTIGDRQRGAKALSNLGFLTAHWGDLDTAENYCIQALDRCREIGARDVEAQSLSNAGIVHRMRGDFATADTYYWQSHDIFHEIGNRRFKASLLRNLSILAREQGALDTAADHCTTSYNIKQEIGDHRGEARSLTTLGTIAYERGDLVTATEHAQESLPVSQESGYPLETARARRLLGRVAGAREQFQTAEDYLTEAQSVFQDMEYCYEEATTLAALGTLARRRNSSVRARERLQDALELYHEIGAIRNSIETGEQLAAVCETRDDFDAALRHCETAYELALNTEFTEPPASLTERRDRLHNRCTDDNVG